MDIKRVAELANLELTSDEEKKFSKELGKVVDYIDQLKEVQTSESEVKLTPGLENKLRSDVIDEKNQLIVEEAVSGGGHVDNNYFVVDRLINEEN